jgi:hypothetical protein
MLYRTRTGTYQINVFITILCLKSVQEFIYTSHFSVKSAKSKLDEHMNDTDKAFRPTVWPLLTQREAVASNSHFCVKSTKFSKHECSCIISFSGDSCAHLVLHNLKAWFKESCFWLPSLRASLSMVLIQGKMAILTCHEETTFPIFVTVYSSIDGTCDLLRCVTPHTSKGCNNGGVSFVVTSTLDTSYYISVLH